MKPFTVEARVLGKNKKEDIQRTLKKIVQLSK
jgi:hypothetical protein